MSLVLGSGVAEEIRQHCRFGAPHEACGALVGHRGGPAVWIPMTNAAPYPTHRFRFARAEYLLLLQRLAETGEELWAVVHSHPHGPSQPSQEDVHAHYAPDVLMVLVSCDSGKWESGEWTLSAWKCAPFSDPRRVEVIDAKGPQGTAGRRRGDGRFLASGAQYAGAVQSQGSDAPEDHNCSAVRAGTDGTSEDRVGAPVQATRSPELGEDETHHEEN